MYIQRIILNTKNIQQNIIYLLIICFSLILLNSVIFNNKLIEAKTNRNYDEETETETGKKDKAKAKKAKAEKTTADANSSAKDYENKYKKSADNRHKQSKNLLKSNKSEVSGFSNTHGGSQI